MRHNIGDIMIRQSTSLPVHKNYLHPNRSCPEIDDETMAAKVEQFAAPRRQFQEANKHLQEKVRFHFQYGFYKFQILMSLWK